MWTLPNAKLVAAVALGVIATMIYRSLIRRDRAESSPLSLEDLLLDPITLKASPSRAVLMGSFGLAFWVIVYHTLAGKLTETEFGAFLLTFAAPAVTSIVGDKFGNKPTAQSGGDRQSQ